MLRTRSLGRRAAALLLTATVAAAAACGSDGTTSPKKSPSPSPLGTYALRQVNQKALPTEIYHGPYFDAPNQHFYDQLVVTVTSGGIELDELNDFSIWIDLKYVGDGGAPVVKRVSLNGTYDVQGSLVIVHIPGAPADGYFTIDNGQIVQVIDLMGKGDVVQYTFKK